MSTTDLTPPNLPWGEYGFGGLRLGAQFAERPPQAGWSALDASADGKDG
ncbi:hypothetical protein [Streptomyces hydrogenans]